MHSIKRILLISVIVIAGVLSIAIFVGYLYRDEVKNIVITSLNKRLTTKVEVGDISFSIIKKFPYPSLELNDVVIHESADFITSGQVVNAQQITLMFSFKSLFGKTYSLKEVIISNALINLQIDKNGNVNYKVWQQPDEKTLDESDLNIDLQNVVFNNTDVLYYNIQKSQDISFLIKKGSLKGNFKSNSYTLYSNADLEKTSVILDEVKICQKHQLFCKFSFGC